MNSKNIFSIVVVVVVVIGLVWYSFNYKKFTQTSNQQSTTQSNQQTTTQSQGNQGVPKQPEMPKFILGSVSRVVGQNVFIKVGPQEKTIITDSKTTFIKQVKDGATFKNVPATFDEIKSPVQIVVYYSTNSGTEYTASKIQILNF